MNIIEEAIQRAHKSVFDRENAEIELFLWFRKTDIQISLTDVVELNDELFKKGHIIVDGYLLFKEDEEISNILSNKNSQCDETQAAYTLPSGTRVMSKKLNNT